MRRTWWCSLIAALAVMLGGTDRSVSTQAAPAPILVVVNSASSNPYGNYLGEILKAEGLNSFSIVPLSSVTSTTLSSAQVVVLAETALTSTQALDFSNFAASGGRLIVMRPDDQLLPALGLTATAPATSTSEGYFALNQASAFAVGLPSATMPFHGQARHYTTASESAVLATVYTNATTATAFPAVVRYRNTITWTYDLARSVIHTRQGDPANATDRDGQPPFRTTDIFYNAIDRDKVPIPYADVQMRMFARAISDLLADAMPLPRLWYFPGTNRTLMILTGDAHANPQSYYDTEISSVESYGGRISIYANGGTSPSATSVNTWRSRGHEVGMHPAAYQNGTTLTNAFQANLNWFTNLYGSNPSRTVRTHQVEWQGWVDAAKVEATYGIGMDTSFYTWGPSITYPDGHQAHGYINGSGQPMRFIDQAGAIVPVFQQSTSLIDEALVTTSFSEHLTPAAATAVSQQIIDASQAGDYAAVTAQFHVDYFSFGEVLPWATGTMNYARSLSIPMWTAEHWLDYTSARYASTITGVTWSSVARQLAFTVTVPTGAEAQSLALPQLFGGFGLTSVTVDGVAAAGTAQTISSRPARFYSIPAGAHAVVVLYNTPLPTATLGVLPATVTQGQSATLSWTTTNATTIAIDQGIGTVAANGSLSVSPLVTTTYTVTATNSAGTATALATLTVIPPAPTVTASISPTAITAGDPATLTWNTTNAGTVTISPGIGTVAASGSRIVSPATTTTYTVTVTNVTGTADATATLTVNPAPAGSSLRFNGSNQRARLTTLPATPVFTVEGWMKRTSDTGRWETFMSDVNGGYSIASVNVYVDGGNSDCGAAPADQFAWAYSRSTGGWFIQCSGVSATLNVWHHVAVSRDASNTARIFIDGVLRGTVTNSATPSTSGAGAFTIGDAGDAADEFFPGLIDEVRVSNVARYTGNFSVQTARFAPDANTVALYHLDAGSGQTLTDASGNGRHGVLGTTSATETVDPVWATDVPFVGAPPTNTAPAITTQPTNQTVTAGQNASFTVAASGTPAPTFQWQVSVAGGAFTNLANAAPYSGVTTATLTITGATAGLSGNQYRAVASNGVLPDATSTAATLTVNVAPAITTQPTAQSVNAGQNATFTAAASGTPAPTVQWQVSTNGGGTFTNLANAAPYSGVTTATLTITAATTGLSGNQYRMVATNVAGSATTTAAALTVTVPPAITTQPANQTVTAGQNASFTVAASGSPAPTYQWQVSTGGGPFTNLANGAPYSGVTTATLTITAAQAGLSGNQYRAIATNVAGTATSTAATLTVNPVVGAPLFTTQPVSVTVNAGLNAVFIVAASGTPAPTFQWQVSVAGGAFTNLAEVAPYSGVTTATLTITGVTAGLSGNQYRAVATNGVVPDATSNAALLTVNVQPAITTSPSNQSVTAGQNATFTVAASGTPAPTFQWQVSTDGGATFTNLANTAPYSGVTTATLSITAVTAGLSGNQYRAIATNSVGSATSAAAGLTVNVLPAITTQPVSQAVNAGQNATFTAAASGTPAPTAQWQVSSNGGSTFTNLTNVAPYSGVTTTTLAITGVTAGLSANQYRMVATNVAGSATTTAAVLTVNVAPAVTTQPVALALTAGQNGTFTVAASGTPAPAFQWQVSVAGGAFTNLANAAPYSGVTTATLTITSATVGLSGNQYRAIATNVAGSATSNAAVLTVSAALPGSSLSFNGSSQRARFTTLPVLTALTVEGWVKRTSDTGRYETFLADASANYGQETVGVYVDGGGSDCGNSPADQFAWAYTKPGGGWFFQCSGVSATLNTWFHVAVTRDASNVARIFINGVLRGTVTGAPVSTTSTGAFAIGTAGDALDEFFPGLVDEVRISNVARYSATFTPQTTPYATDANTVALYHLDEGSGQAVTDSSGNGRHGVLGATSAVETVDPGWSSDSPVH